MIDADRLTCAPRSQVYRVLVLVVWHHAVSFKLIQFKLRSVMGNGRQAIELYPTPGTSEIHQVAYIVCMIESSQWMNRIETAFTMLVSRWFSHPIHAARSSFHCLLYKSHNLSIAEGIDCTIELCHQCHQKQTLARRRLASPAPRSEELQSRPALAGGSTTPGNPMKSTT